MGSSPHLELPGSAGGVDLLLDPAPVVDTPRIDDGPMTMLPPLIDCDPGDESDQPEVSGAEGG